MPTYVTLIHYTEQGVQTFKDLSRRLDETRRSGEAVGAKLISYYLTMGQYDAIAITDAPDDEAIAKLALAAGAARQRQDGNVAGVHRGRSQGDRGRVVIVGHARRETRP